MHVYKTCLYIKEYDHLKKPHFKLLQFRRQFLPSAFVYPTGICNQMGDLDSLGLPKHGGIGLIVT